MPETYGGYNMPGDEFFYLSSMYSDKLLTEFLPKVKNRAYQRYIQIQKDILNGNEIQGSLVKSESTKHYFKVSDELCEEFGFPDDSIFADITDQEFYLDIADKIKFFKTFGDHTPISYFDIITHPDIFKSVLHCRIGDYAFTKFYIVNDKFNRVFLCIKNSNTDGLSKSAIDALTADNPSIGYCIWKDDFNPMYQYTDNINNIMSNSSTFGMKRITIPKSSLITSIGTFEDNNWTIMISYHTNKYGTSLYSTTDCILVSETNTVLTFDVPKVFLDDICLRNSVVSCILMQRINRKAIFEYDPNNDTEPWLALGSYDNPVSVANIKIYQYDKETFRYLDRKPILIDNFNKEFDEKVKKDQYNESNYYSNMIFPSIYNFNSINCVIRIEILRYNSNITNTGFDNHIKSLFQYPDYDTDNLTKEADYNSDRYLNYLTWLYNNKNDETYGDVITSNLNLLTKYNPINVYMDYEDYNKSGLTMRHYKFGKLLELIHSDPYIYADYIKFMDKMNFNIIKECGSPNYFKLNSGLSDYDLTSSTPTVTDDSVACNKTDVVTTFSEPNTYIKIHANNPDAFCLVYIGGRLITPTEVKNNLNDIYIFLPVNTVKKYITEAMNLINSLNDTRLRKENLVIVECYNRVNRSESTRKDFMTVFENTSIPMNPFESDNDLIYKLSDLVIYNKFTGEYIPLSKFDIIAELHTKEIEFKDGSTEKISGSTDDLIYMGTHLNEFYMTQDDITIILEGEIQDFEFPKDEFDGGKKDDYSGFLNKDWKNTDLKFILTDPDLVGAEIVFSYSPISYEWDIPFTEFTKNNSNEYVYDITGFIGKNDIRFFELYVNGELLDPTDYLTLPNSVNADSKITITLPNVSNFDQWYNNTTYIIQLRYNPTTYIKAKTKYVNLLSRYDSAFDSNAIYDLTMPIFDYNVFATDFYLSNTTHLNSDCSKLFDTAYKTTAIAFPYKWNTVIENIDLQSKMNILAMHPAMYTDPYFKDINEDIQFFMYTNSINRYPLSIVDQLSVDESKYIV